jgi:phenylpropionate dioxygenase-like ring-hydroxylating dioxygenase large terminal subunit
MIRNQWYVVLDSNEVKPNKPVGVTRLGEKLVFWRDAQGKVVCMRDLCPHLGAPLSLGQVKEGTLVCPFHGFEFDPSGNCRLVPALGRNGAIPKALRAAAYPTYEAHDFIWIYWGEVEDINSLSKPPFYEDIDATFSYSSLKKHWGVHYSRMVENQLDVMHLPFVHRTTIGAGGRTVVDGPLVKLENNTLHLWVYNRLDDGTPPRKMEDLPEPDRPPFLIFHFPNLWENRISDQIRIVVAFVPVDEENGLFYGRYYQNIVRVPILRELFNLAGKWSSIVIANQDHRIVTRQVPKKTALKKMGEKLLPGDRAILTYRQHRHKLKVETGQEEA